MCVCVCVCVYPPFFSGDLASSKWGIKGDTRKSIKWGGMPQRRQNSKREGMGNFSKGRSCLLKIFKKFIYKKM